jgi:DNA-directed RNA polymerase specialized sigma24 family protein
MSQPSWWYLAMRLHRVHGWTYEAIAQELGVDPRAVKYAVDAKHRGRMKAAFKRYRRDTRDTSGS